MYFPQHSPTFRRALEGLRGHPVAVLGHLRPDGDCIGSQVALTRVLISLGIDAIAVNADPVPRILADFVGNTPWRRGTEYQPAPGTLAACVDCADHGRIGPRLREMFPHPQLVVDHHLSNLGFGEDNFVLPTTSATGEVLAGMFLDNGLKFDAVTAQALYLGIATDTGQFRYPATTPQVFRICGELMAAGANPSAAAELLYERESAGKMRLLQTFLSSFRLEFGGRVCIGFLRDADYAAAGASRDDAEGLVEYARAIEGVDVGVLLEERKGLLKGSLRAKDARFAMHRLAQIFQGGGHACAAGFNQEDLLEAFYPRFLNILKDHLAAVDKETQK